MFVVATELRRVFFALWPAPELAQRLSSLGAGQRGRATHGEDLHLTLAFLGEQDEASMATLLAIASRLALPRCEIVLDRLGYWRHNRILWAGPSELPPALRNFVASLHAGLRKTGFKLDEREFAAHVTLLRNATRLPAEQVFEPLVWPIEAWCLAESRSDETGRRYRELASWPSAREPLLPSSTS